MQEEEQMLNTASFSCPSFNSYSTNHQVANVAAKVLAEQEQDQQQSDDDDFEFVSVRKNPDDNGAVSSGDEEVFPVFDRSLLNDYNHLRNCGDDRDRDDDVASSSSSEWDGDLQGVRPGTYCVWTPPKTSPPPSPGRCKKSNSTGSSSSRRWRLRDLLRRSSSDGGKRQGESSSSSSSSSYVVVKEADIGNKEVALKGKGKGKEKGKKVSAHEVFYVRSKAMREGDKRKSYLPYKQDLVGFFANVNGLGLSKTFSPF